MEELKKEVANNLFDSSSYFSPILILICSILFLFDLIRKHLCLGGNYNA